MRDASMSLLLANAIASACSRVISIWVSTPIRAGRRNGRTGGTSVVVASVGRRSETVSWGEPVWVKAGAGGCCAKMTGSVHASIVKAARRGAKKYLLHQARSPPSKCMG